MSGYLPAGVFDKQVGGKVRYPDRVVLVFDHHFSPPTEQQAKVLQSTRDRARRQGVRLFDCGSGNIHHVLMRRGLVKPGMIVVGSDSHTPVHGTAGALAVALGNESHTGTVMPYGKAWFNVPHTVRVELSGSPRPGTTPRDIALWLVAQIGEGELNYASIEFAGPYLKQLEFCDRWLFPLLCVDLGAKCAFAETSETGEPAQVLRFDVGGVGPQVACRPTAGNVRTVPDVAGKAIDWVELGWHGGGRLEDIRAAAAVLAGRNVHPSVRTRRTTWREGTGRSGPLLEVRRRHPDRPAGEVAVRVRADGGDRQARARGPQPGVPASGLAR